MKSKEDEIMKRIRARLIHCGSGKAIAELQAKLSESQKQVQALVAEYEKNERRKDNGKVQCQFNTR